VEGNNSVQCAYCRSRLLLTGRRRILTYYVPPAITTDKQALKYLKKALMEGPGPRKVIRFQLCFLPYYRLTGHEFIWRRPSALARKEIPNEWDEVAASISGGEISFFREEVIRIETADVFDSDLFKKLEFQERYLEKNFVALDVPGLGAYSLGVRASIMKLRLYNRDALQAMGKIVPPDIDADSARARGLVTSGSEEILHREVLAMVLSVIFFPFWIVETEHHGQTLVSIIDGVSGALTSLDLPASTLDYLKESQTPDVETVGFLPMKCPHCGWELAGPQDGVVFSCEACIKAWLLGADGLSLMPCRVAAGPSRSGGKIKHLPFWTYSGTGQEGGAPLYVPGFRYRRLKSLHDTARQMFRRQPQFEFTEPQRVDLEGCFYDCEDAQLLASFMLRGLPDIFLIKNPAVRTDIAPTLIWFPYYIQGTNWVNPYTGTALQSALLA
jgi:hypothetical protein